MGTTGLYDCYRDFEGSWPFKKKAWCCKHEGISCAALQSQALKTTTRPSTQTTTQTTTTSRAAPTTTTTRGIVTIGTGDGVTSTSTSLPYECEVGLANWELGWT